MPDPIAISLTRGCVTIIDAVDSDLTAIKWRAIGDWLPYAWCTNRKPAIGLHRVILERVIGRPLLSHEQVDHINCDSLDNRRCNLRLCTSLQNRWNTPKPRRSPGKYKGVTWNKNRSKWQASIGHHNKSIYLGLFDTEAEAAHAYDVAARNHFGEFANLNFPECLL